MTHYLEARPLIVFAAAAVVAFAGFAWRGWGRYGAAWLVAEAAFVAAALQFQERPFVAFAGLFVIPTVVFGIVSVWKKSAGPLFLMCASSDLALMVGFTVHHAQTFSWSVPAPGAYSAGAVAVVVAAALRLGSAGSFGSREATALGSVGWWQGAALAWWAAASARPASVALGVVLLAAGAATLGTSKKGSEGSPGRRPAMLVAGGLVMLLSASGVNAGVLTGELALASLGLAAAALALGARPVAVWALAALPLSAATLHSPAEGLVSPLSAATFLALLPLWAWTALRLTTPRPGPGGGGLAFFSIAAALPLAVRSIGPAWAAAALLVAIAAALAVKPSEETSTPQPPEAPDRIPSWLVKPVDQIRKALPAQPPWMPKWAPLFGLAPLAVALALLGRLTALGLNTRFL